MADGYYDPILGAKREAALPDLQLPVYRGEGVPTGDQMTPDQRRLMAVLEAIKRRRMMQQMGQQNQQAIQGAQGGQGGMVR